MIGRLAVRSLTAHPVRTGVLAAGFGVGVAVMAILLGVAEVVLDQAQAPALVGGGDVVVQLQEQVPARLLLAGTLLADGMRSRVRTAAPSHRARLYLERDGQWRPVRARGGIPSRERALGDPETADVANWQDTATDVAWAQDTPEQVLRYIDRFHQIPDAPDWADSWAEWLYFNGRGAAVDGAAAPRFYLTFMVGPRLASGRRAAGVRLQLERDGVMQNFSGSATLAEADVMQAPDLTIGASQVRLNGLRYDVRLDLRGDGGARVVGTLSLESSPGKLVPPIEIGGARGWRTGYVVPVMAGRLGGTLDVAGTRLTFDGGTGYHDHNWGFWEGVSWQWGQVQQDDLSFLYGRVFPPPEAADPARMPGFVGALGPDGPLGYATNVTIAEQDDGAGRPQRITVRARGTALDVQLRFDVGSAVTTRMAGQGPLGNGLDFLQMRGTYTVSGRAAGRKIAFSAPGAAETFRGTRR